MEALATEGLHHQVLAGAQIASSVACSASGFRDLRHARPHAAAGGDGDMPRPAPIAPKLPASGCERRQGYGRRFAISSADLCYPARMDRNTVISRLKAHEAELRGLGVQHLWLFGSMARGDARPDSDVDLFFDHEWGKLSLFDIMEVQEVVARILGCDTDVMTRDSLHPVLRDRIENSALLVF
jgi:uncharacterized protein